MEATSWLRQTSEPLYPDILWSRPENKRLAGKLLIIGGHKQSFNAVSDAYAASLQAGVGSARVILPEALRTMLKTVFPEAEYAPSNSIGSFNRQALSEWLEAATWADDVLLAGDFGRNSETAVLLEGFLDKYGAPLTVSGDSLDYFLKEGRKLTQRPDTVIVASLDKLQRLLAPAVALKQTDDLAQLVGKLAGFTGDALASIVGFSASTVLVAVHGTLSSTALNEVNNPKLSAYLSTWWLQQPQKKFEALTTAVWCYGHAND